MASVVAVPTALNWPDGSILLSVMSLPERGVVPLVRVPERVKDWLTAGFAFVVVTVRAVGVRVPTVSVTEVIEGA